MKRRTFLEATGVATVGALAGCTAPGQSPVGEQTTGEGGTTATTGGNGTAGGTETGTATTGTQTTQGGGGGGGTTNTVAMVTSQGGDFYFDPIGLFVEPGTTVSFVIESGAHSSTAYHQSVDSASVTRIPDGAEPWNSGIISGQGSSFDHTFQTPGTYDYFCIPHKTLGMVGRIVCGEPGGVEGDPPDGNVPSEQTIVQQGAVSYSEFSG